MQMQVFDVNNPLNQSEHCRLFNKRADPRYYTHRYDPGPILEYYIDAMLLGDIIAKIPFNIIVSPMGNKKTYVSAILNMPYSSTFDMFYDDSSVVGFLGGNRKRQNLSRKNNNKINKNHKKKRQSRYRIKKRIITRRTSTSCKCK